MMEVILFSWKVDLNEGFVCLSLLFSIVLGKIPFYCLSECNIHIVMKKTHRNSTLFLLRNYLEAPNSIQV